MLPAARRTNRLPVRGHFESPKRTKLSRALRFASAHKKIVLPIAGVVLLVLIYSTGRVLAGQHKPSTKEPGTTQTTAKKVDPMSPVTDSPRSTAQTITSSSQLDSIIATWAGQQSFPSSVVVKQLTGGSQSSSYKSDASMVPASTYKIYVAYAILHGVEQGSYTLSTATSDGHTIQTDLNSMILNSDNSAARTLGFLYGWKNINTLLKSQGINNTDLYNYVPPSTDPVGDKHTTAGDLASTLNKLYNEQLLNHTNTQLLLSLMKQQHYRERIPAGVPSGITVADKPGWLSPADGVNEYIQNDAAIVYGPKSTYILTIVTTSHSTQPLASLSKLIYNQLEL